jgi:hypothetical protein
MSFFGEGNLYLQYSYLTNSTATNNIITTSQINTSSIDMLSSTGQYQYITNVHDPNLRQDAATKNYVDALGISINQITLTSTTGTVINSNLTGAYMITVNTTLNGGPYGPNATFNISKSDPSKCGHVVRPSHAPGSDSSCCLDIRWPPNSGPILFKTNVNFDGGYYVKNM